DNATEPAKADEPVGQNVELAKPAPSSTRTTKQGDGQPRKSSGEPASPKPSQSGADKAAATAGDIKATNRWFGEHGHIGAIVKSVAEDFRDGHKKWQEAGVTTREGRVAIRHPEGWKGCGVATREILPMLQECGWVEVDPFQAIKKVRDIPGFAGANGQLTRSAIVLPKELSMHFLTIAGEPATGGKPVSNHKASTSSGSNKGKRNKRKNSKKPDKT